MTDITPGRYKHYKGKEYDVIGVGLHSETHEALVIYQGRYESVEFGSRPLWVRPLSSFLEMVEWEGKKVPRFLKLD